jgi:serine/threonine protein kinase
MDISNLTKKSFTDLVDPMLEIIYTGDNNSNEGNIKKINDLINIVCNNKLTNTTFKIQNNTHNKLNKNLIKILPCNNDKSLITKNIDFKNIKTKGSTSIIFNIINNNKFIKITISESNDYQSLFGFIFQYFLYNLINKPNYLCKTYEIGKYNVVKDFYFYSIMDNCGVDLIDFLQVTEEEQNKKKVFKLRISIEDKNIKNINILFNNLLIIFYKMIECIKILHDLGYAHLDIKPENFLISSNDKKNKLLDLIFTTNIENIVLIKIIDFGLVRKIGSKINIEKSGLGTIQYAHPDLIGEKKDVVISPIYDIEMLRKSFIFIIGIIFLNPANYESKETNKPKKFNETINNILIELSKLKNKPIKLDGLLEILNNITIGTNIYTNIDFLLNAFYCLLYDFAPINFAKNFESTNITLKNNNVKTELAKKMSEITIIPISDYYLLWYKKLLEINKNTILLKLYDKVKGESILELKEYNNSNKERQKNIKKSLTKYLLPINDITTGYIIDVPSTKITYFRKITDQKYISLKTYFSQIFDEWGKFSEWKNEYIKLTHVLHIFSLIMDCIELFEYLLDYGLNVLLDNFVIDKDTKLFTLDIDLKIVGGIVNIKIDTRPIEILGNEMFDVLSNFSIFKNDNFFSFFKNNKNKNTNNKQAKLNKLINIQTEKETSLIKRVKQEDIYRTELSEIIETMIFKSIDIMTLIGKFKKIRKTIYLNKILENHYEIVNDIDMKVSVIYGVNDDREIFSRKIILDKNDYDEKKYKKNSFEIQRCILEFLLYSYIYYFYQSQIKYLCEIQKIGYIKNEKEYYSLINKNCGISLNTYFNNLRNLLSHDNSYIIFNNFLKIFYEMLFCIEILHESGYLCLYYSEKFFVIADNNTEKINNKKFTNDNFLLKIIDFSKISRIGISRSNPLPFKEEAPYDWQVYLYKKHTENVVYRCRQYDDIFLLGQFFKTILTKQGFDESFYTNLGFGTIVDKMCNIHSSDGYQDIHSLIIDFEYLLKTINEETEKHEKKNIKEEKEKYKNRKEIEIDDYIIYYYDKKDISSIPYIVDKNKLEKKYPITKDIIEAIINNKKINKNNNISTTEYILKKLKKDDIDKIIAGTYLEKVPSNENIVPIDFGLENIFFILVRILFKKLETKHPQPIYNRKFYDSVYKKYRGSNEFILVVIYELLCENFSEELNNLNNNLSIKNLILNLKKINFLQYSFKDKKKINLANKKSINDLGEKDLFSKINSKNFQEGENYFYAPNNDSILYFGKITKIPGMINKNYFFKYYIRAADLCSTIELSPKELEKIKFYEFNRSTQSNTKTLRRIEDKSSFLSRFNSLISKNNKKKLIITNIPIQPAPIKANKKLALRDYKKGSNVSAGEACYKYDESLPQINDYSNVDNWVFEFCKKYDIEITNNITINPDTKSFDSENFQDFRGTTIYESGVGYLDCLIRSLLFSMSNNYRCLKGNKERTNVASYFRRAFLPWFFNNNKEKFKKIANYNISEDNGILYIKDNDKQKNLNELLCRRIDLPDIIGDILSKELKINLLIFGPAIEYNKETNEYKVKNKSIDNYTPTLKNNESKFTICICGDNKHFKSCKIMYKGKNDFIIDTNVEELQKSYFSIIENKDYSECFTFNGEKYKIHTSITNNKSGKDEEILYLFAYKLDDKEILNDIKAIEGVNLILSTSNTNQLFSLNKNKNNKNTINQFHIFNQNKKNNKSLYFYNDSQKKLYKIHVFDMKEHKDKIILEKCNIKANIKKGNINQEKVEANRKKIEANKIKANRILKEQEKIEDNKKAERSNQRKKRFNIIKKAIIPLAKTEKNRLAKIESNRVEAEKNRLAKIEANRLEAEKTQKIESNRVEAEKNRLAKIEANRLEAEKTQKIESNRVEAEKNRLAKIEANRLEAEKTQKIESNRVEAEKNRLAKIEANRLEAEKTQKIESNRVEAEKNRLAKIEANRLEAEKTQKIESNRLEAEKNRLAKIEANRLEAEKTQKIESNRVEAEKNRLAKIEANRLEAEKTQKIESNRVEAEKNRLAKIEANRLEAEKTQKIESNRLEAEKNRLAKIEDNRVATEKAEKNRVIAEKAEENRLAKIEVNRLAAEKVKANKPKYSNLNINQYVKKYTHKKKKLFQYTNFYNIEDIDNILLHINKTNSRYDRLKHSVKQLKEKKNIMEKEILQKYDPSKKKKGNTIKYTNLNNINKIRQILKNINQTNNKYKLLEPVLKTLETKQEKKQKDTSKANNTKLLKKALFYHNPFA